MTPEFQELLDCARDILKQEAHVLEWPHYLRLREAVIRVEQVKARREKIALSAGLQERIEAFTGSVSGLLELEMRPPRPKRRRA